MASELGNYLTAKRLQSQSQKSQPAKCTNVATAAARSPRRPVMIGSAAMSKGSLFLDSHMGDLSVSSSFAATLRPPRMVLTPSVTNESGPPLPQPYPSAFLTPFLASERLDLRFGGRMGSREDEEEETESVPKELVAVPPRPRWTSGRVEESEKDSEGGRTREEADEKEKRNKDKQQHLATVLKHLEEDVDNEEAVDKQNIQADTHAQDDYGDVDYDDDDGGSLHRTSQDCVLSCSPDRFSPTRRQTSFHSANSVSTNNSHIPSQDLATLLSTLLTQTSQFPVTLSTSMSTLTDLVRSSTRQTISALKESESNTRQAASQGRFVMEKRMEWVAETVKRSGAEGTSEGMRRMEEELASLKNGMEEIKRDLRKEGPRPLSPIKVPNGVDPVTLDVFETRMMRHLDAHSKSINSLIERVLNRVDASMDAMRLVSRQTASHIAELEERFQKSTSAGIQQSSADQPIKCADSIRWGKEPPQSTLDSLHRLLHTLVSQLQSAGLPTLMDSPSLDAKATTKELQGLLGRLSRTQNNLENLLWNAPNSSSSIDRIGKLERNLAEFQRFLEGRLREDLVAAVTRTVGEETRRLGCRSQGEVERLEVRGYQVRNWAPLFLGSFSETGNGLLTEVLTIKLSSLKNEKVEDDRQQASRTSSSFQLLLAPFQGGSQSGVHKGQREVSPGVD